MKVSQNWLKNLVEITSTPEDLSEKLSIGGFEVESLEDCSKNVNGVVLLLVFCYFIIVLPRWAR